MAGSVAEVDAELLEVKDAIRQLERYIANVEQELELTNVPVETRLQLLNGKELRLHDLYCKERVLKRMFPIGLPRLVLLMAHSRFCILSGFVLLLRSSHRRSEERAQITQTGVLVCFMYYAFLSVESAAEEEAVCCEVFETTRFLHGRYSI